MFRLFVLSVFCFSFSFLQADTYASPAYSLSSLDQFDYMPPMTTKPTSSLEDLVFVSTVYETSQGLKGLLYTTTRFKLKDGKLEMDVLGGPSGSKLGSQMGVSTIVYKGENTVVFLHREEAQKVDFANVLYFLSGMAGELVMTSGDQYAKSYVRIEQKPKGL